MPEQQTPRYRLTPDTVVSSVHYVAGTELPAVDWPKPASNFEPLNDEARGAGLAAVAASGKGYSLASASSYGAVKMFRDNLAGSGVSTVVEGLNLIPVEFTNSPNGPYRRFIMAKSVFTTTPGAGAWVQGDTIEFMDPASAGYTGTKCTASGSPGTWKNYGLIN
jgi:hypothetical protein